TLALLIAVTSQQMAVARGMAYDAAGQVILCTGQGVVTVTLNTQGEPMDVVHICPDCALTLMAAVGALLVLEPLIVHSQTLTQTPVTTAQTTISPAAFHARGPPLTA
ncbi:MAG: hypothetical protein ACSHW1_18660, partial [Yoonia sp.]|uniref:hypothetical protein n=1 Tax=Yoonia sp. TaxID=2212373 RepID=UPI003EF6F65A